MHFTSRLPADYLPTLSDEMYLYFSMTTEHSVPGFGGGVCVPPCIRPLQRPPLQSPFNISTSAMNDRGVQALSLEGHFPAPTSVMKEVVECERDLEAGDRSSVGVLLLTE